MNNVGNALAVAKVSNAVSNVMPKSDPEDPKQKKNEDDEPLLTWEDFYKRPCLFGPILVFTATGFLGLVLIILALLKITSFTLSIVGGIILFIVGIWAAVEMRSLGTLHDQIKRLKDLREKLQAQTMALQGQVGDMQQENKELEENVEAFRNQNNELEKNVNVFDHTNDDLRSTLSELQGANSKLAEDVQDLNDKNKELETILVKMSEQKDKITEDLDNFDELRHHMESMAEESGEKMHDMILKTMTKFDAMDSMVRENERVLLRQIASDVEMFDDKEGHSRQEFKRFIARLPKRYRAIVEDKNINFDTLDKDKDESLDPAELTVLIDQLITENEARQAAKKKNLALHDQESEI